jgi:ankyrin repeat protein
VLIFFPLVCPQCQHTALFYVARFSKHDVARVLVQSGAELNLRDYVRSTVLVAPGQRCCGIADFTFRSVLPLKRGYTALMWAAESGNTEGVRIILQSGRADVTIKGNVRDAPFLCCMRHCALVFDYCGVFLYVA